MINAKLVQVVLVDDDIDLLETMSSTFKLFGLSVVCFTNGRDALEHIKNEPVDIVISDVRMPNGDGMELLNKLKEINTKYPKVLLVSGFSDYSVGELYQLGVDGFFSKPFNASEVRAAIKLAMIKPIERWRSKGDREVVAQLNLDLDDLETGKNEDTLFLGRGGFCVLTDESSLAVSENIHFEFNFKNRSPISQISGVAVIRWMSSGKKPGQTYLGCEFLEFKDHCLEKAVEFFEEIKTRSFIPRPKS